VYRPKKKEEVVQKMDIDSERTTELDQINTMHVALDDKNKRPIVEDNPVKKVVPAANDHEASTSKSQYFLPKWCPSGLTRTERRKLQRLRCHERKVKELEQQRDEYFDKYKPVIPQKKVWRVKTGEKVETTPQAVRPDGAGGLTGCDTDQVVQPGHAEKLPGDVSSAPIACDDKLTSVPTAEDDEQLVDYSSSPEHKNIDTNAPYMGVFVLMGEDDYHAEFGPEEVI
jgi:hypothetical protein